MKDEMYVLYCKKEKKKEGFIKNKKIKKEVSK